MKRLSLFAAVIGCLVLAATTAHAVGIGVNFEGLEDDAAKQNLLGSTDSAGVVPQTNWTNASGAAGTLNDLIDDSGVATTADVTWVSALTWSWERSERDVPANGDGTMFNGYLDTTGNDGSTTVTITQIPYAVYDLYVYIDGENFNARPARFNVSPAGSPDTGTSIFVNDTANWNGTFVEATATALPGTDGANYVLFSDLSMSDIVVFAEAETFRAVVNGVQIVSVIPEPSTLVLAGLGFIALIGIARRRRR